MYFTLYKLSVFRIIFPAFILVKIRWKINDTKKIDNYVWNIEQYLNAVRFK